MPLGQCVWCGRWRLVTLRTWSSSRSHEQLCGEVCEHCYYGNSPPDDCRTCRAKQARGVRVGRQPGVRPLEREDIQQLLAMQGARKRKKE